MVVALALLCLVGSAWLTTGAAGERRMVGVYELRRGDFSVKVTNWGAIVMSVVLPDSRGNVQSPCSVPCCWDPPFTTLLVLQGTWLMSSLAKTPSLNTL
jgi:hypothetical protein